MTARARIAAISWAIVACGGAGGDPKLASKNAVDVVLTGPKLAVPFDDKSARLEEATAQLHALVGHPIAFELDTGIFSESKDKFEDMVLGDVEVVAADLAKAKKTAPLAFAHGVPLVWRVRLKYDATYDQRDVEARFDPDARAITITGRGGGWSVPAGAVLAALLRELDDYAMRHFGPAEPDAIAPRERVAYFEFLVDYRKRQKWLTDHPKPQTRPRYPDAELVRKIARLAAIGPREGAVADEMRKWLFERMSDFESAYRGDADAIQALAETSEWRVAERAYVAWMSSVVASASYDERAIIARNAFMQRDGHTPGWVFPGFDTMGFALAVFDDWSKAGHPAANASVEPSSRRNLYASLVCPIATKADGTREPLRCDHAFYRYAIDGDANLRRLGDTLVARGDAKLVETVFAGIASLPRADKTGALVALTHALAKDDALYKVALREMSEDVALIDASAFAEELRRVWAAEPAKRPTVLFTLAWFDRYAPHFLEWDKFAAQFGAPATAADLGAMLDLPRAMLVVNRVWPALGKGWSRAQVLEPFLTSFVDGERAPGEADDSIRGIAHALCQERNDADNKELVAFFDKRRAAHPAERYAKIVSESSTCRR